MRNLKKILALVLALVMSLSLVTIAGAASTTTTAKYDAAIKALENYGVLQGYTDGKMHENDNITRAQMAAIVYRLMTGDTQDPTDTDAAAAEKYGPYATNKFKDVNKNAWYIGYIGWCANQGVLKGYPGGTVKPDEQIKGYEVQAMLLRALGYDQNNEYTGNDYEYKVLADATKTGINKGVDSDPAKVTLRGAVAQLTYNAARNTTIVKPAIYPSIGYNSTGDPLISVGATTEKTNAFGAYTQSTAITFNWPDTPVSGSYATVTKPLWETYDAVTECDVAKGLGVDGQHWATTYTNGSGNVNLWNGNATNANAMPFEATDTVNKIGHEGRHFMVYANPKFSGTESATNPKYIFVFVDEFYAKVDSTWDAVVDPAGHVVRAAGANVTVYSNNYANGSTAAGSATALTRTATLTGDGYTVGQILGVHLLTNTPTNGLTSAPTVVTNTTAPGYGPFALSTATVTVKDITMDTAAGVLAGNPVGIVATNGARYFYNYTCSDKPITGADIGKSVVLTLDSQGNILKWTYAPSTAGFGVTLSASVKQIAIGQYVLTYEILLPDGSKTTVDVGQATTGAAFTDQTTAETYYKNTVGANKLVYFAPGSTGPYNAFTTGNVTAAIRDNTIVSGRPQALSESYTTDPVRGDTSSNAAANGSLLNDNTVFFVANYAPDNTTVSDTDDYVFTGYSIYVGEKNIPDMTFTSGSKTKTPADAQGAAQAVSALTVEAFEVGAGGAPATAATAGGYAKYVLIVNATKQSTPKTIPVMNYAYLVTNDLFVDMGATTFTYPAIINGQTGQNLQVKLAGGALKNEGLYTYANWTNGEGYSDVVLMNGTANNTAAFNAPYKGSFTIAKDLYAYADGVLTSYAAAGSKTTPAAGDVYYAVAAGCPVYLVNPTTGKVTTNGLGLLNVSQYASACEIWFQLDANGYVSLIYMIDTATPTTPVPPTSSGLTLTLNSATATGTDGSATITVNDLKVDGSGTLASGSPTVTVNYVIEKWTDNGWTAYCTAKNEVTLASGTYTFSNESVTANTPLYEGTYRLTVTAKSGDATATLTEYLGLSITA